MRGYTSKTKAKITRKLKNFDKENKEVALSCVILLFLWQIVAIIINNEIYLPTIEQVLGSIIEIISEERFCIDIVLTSYRTIISFLIALLLSTLLAILGVINSSINSFFKPINSIFKSIPMMILIVLSLIWFDKDSSPYIIGTITVFPILYENIFGSIESIDNKILEMTYIYEVSLIDKILKVYIPTIKFRVISIISSTISLVLKVVIAGEIYGQPKYGIGSIVQVEKMNFNTTAIFAWLVIIVLMCKLIDILQEKLLRGVFLWDTKK